MRILTCASYYGTGSSAITDLLSEYECCKSMSEYEFRFVQDPEGISDLEYNLVENHHRHNSGHALKRYKKKVDFLAGNKIIKKYEPFFNYHWKEYSYEYIDKLTEFSYKGYWHQDVIDRGEVFYFVKRLHNKILQKTIWKNQKDRNLDEMKKEITLCSAPSQGQFLDLTREYIDKLFGEANGEKKPNIIVDQIVPPSNVNRYLRYFNDIKVFVVDRDPRDIYLLEKYIWKGKVIPTESVEVFCEWYKYTRKHRNTEIYDQKKVMFIQFEDLIYDYERSVKNIEQWLGIDSNSHKYKFNHLNPKNSKKNTQIWKQIQCPNEEIKFIESNLNKYLYDFEKNK
ncbi:MAG: hypothetical protein ACLTBU_10660 [Zhenhengia sp.]|uniref:hypothetical protein n=1 Tax=Zhenhengia sp. TaxID=2944208 RepID=UPI0039953217